MSKQQQNVIDDQDKDIDEDDFSMRPRIDVLKERARSLGISHSPNIGEAKLAEKIDQYLLDTQGINDNDGLDDDDTEDGDLPIKRRQSTPKKSEAEIKADARKQAQLLVRVNVTPNDPRCIQLNGELILTGNALTGTIGKFVPFNTPRGYLIPQSILNVLKDRTYTHFRYRKDAYGNDIPYPVQRKAFNIEIMKPLTQKQIDAIAKRQIAAARWDEEQDDSFDLPDDED